MNTKATVSVSVGVHCWLWDLGAKRRLLQLAREAGVCLNLSNHFGFLRRDIRGIATGDQGGIDRFVRNFFGNAQLT